MRNDFNFWKNTCQVQYGIINDLEQYNFSIFSAYMCILLGLLIKLENFENNFPLG